MRQYILTEQEKTIIKRYLETGQKLKGFRMLLSRAKRLKRIENDMVLIKEFVAKNPNT